MGSSPVTPANLVLIDIQLKNKIIKKKSKRSFNFLSFYFILNKKTRFFIIKTIIVILIIVPIIFIGLIPVWSKIDKYFSKKSRTIQLNESVDPYTNKSIDGVNIDSSSIPSTIGFISIDNKSVLKNCFKISGNFSFLNYSGVKNYPHAETNYTTITESKRYLYFHSKNFIINSQLLFPDIDPKKSNIDYFKIFVSLSVSDSIKILPIALLPPLSKNNTASTYLVYRYIFIARIQNIYISNDDYNDELPVYKWNIPAVLSNSYFIFASESSIFDYNYPAPYLDIDKDKKPTTIPLYCNYYKNDKNVHKINMRFYNS